MRDPLAGRLLSDPEWVGYLGPFLGRESSISAAARELRRPLDAVRYRVRRLLRAGLVEVVREVPRAGRAVRIYRSTADGFVVPFDVTPFADHEERLRASLASGNEVVVRAAARALRASGLEGRRIRRGDDGEIHQEAAAQGEVPWAPGGDAIEAHAIDVEMTRERSREVLGELRELFERVRRASDDDAERGPRRSYHLAFQIAPRDDA